MNVLEYVAVPGSSQTICLNQLMGLRPLTEVAESSVLQPLVVAANAGLARLKQGSSCPDAAQVAQWLRVWEVSQSLHAFHAVSMFSGADQETTAFDKRRQALSSMLLHYFQNQFLSAEFERACEQFTMGLAAFKASRHEEFVRNFFMLLMPEGGWNQRIWNQLQTLSLGSAVHPLILQGETLTHWLECYSTAEGHVDLSTYEINRILMQPLLLPPTSWSMELRSALDLVSNWLLEPVGAHDNASLRALKGAFSASFLCSIQALLCVLNADAPRLPNDFALDSLLKTPLFLELMQRNGALLPQFLAILNPHWGKIILNSAELKTLLDLPGLNHEQRRTIWMAVMEYRDNIAYLIRQDPTLLLYPFMDTQLLGYAIREEGPYQGMTIFYLLFTTPAGLQLLWEKWEFFADKLDQQTLNQIVITEGPYKGMTLFYVLFTTMVRQQLLRGKWAFFADKLDKKTLNQVVTGEGPNKGTTLFYVLCSTSFGLQLLREKWAFFADKLDKETLNQIVTAETSDKGTTPFSMLFGTEAGWQLLREKWEFFADKLDKKTLNQVVTGEGPYKGTNLFYWLCCIPGGLQLLREKWQFFVDKLDKETLNQAVTGEGPYKGITPFYWLCTNSSGRQLLREKWEFFADKLDKETLNQIVIGEGLEGATPFYFLCISPGGVQLLHKNWDFFIDKLDKKTLNQVVTGEGSHKGKSPFYRLCTTPEGVQLLREKWEFFATNLDKATLNKVITDEGPAQGTSPFYYLCATRAGQELLREQWDFFAANVDKASFNQVVTGEGTNKGKTPFDGLRSTPEGQKLMRDKMAVFAHWMTQETQNEPIASHGMNGNLTDLPSHPFSRKTVLEATFFAESSKKLAQSGVSSLEQVSIKFGNGSQHN